MKKTGYKLSLKIILLFFALSLSMIIMMVLATRHFSIKNFENYVTTLEIEHSTDLIEKLKSEYRKNRSWEKFEKNHWLWFRLLKPKYSPPHFGRDRVADMEKKDRAPGEPEPPPHFGKEDEGMPPPFGFPAPPKHGDALGIGKRVALLDENRETVAGPTFKENRRVTKPIEIDGRVVGFLAIKKRVNFNDLVNKNFIDQLSKFLYIMGIVSLSIYLIISIFLLKYLLSPLKSLIRGTQDIASYNLKTRVSYRSSDELGMLADHFNVMAEKLEKKEKMEKEWISDISHELRTPLAILQGEIEAIQDGVRQVTHQTFESLNGEVKNITKIVEDLHTLSVADSGSLSIVMESCPVVFILEEILNSFVTRFESKNIQIRKSLSDTDSLFIECDPFRLRQIFTNILENSLRYTDAPGVLQISVSEEAGKVLICFSDSEPSVPKESFARLFERLYRPNKSRSRVAGGSGLGLSICSTFAELMGGEISADHSDLGGVKIAVKFPILKHNREV